MTATSSRLRHPRLSRRRALSTLCTLFSGLMVASCAPSPAASPPATTAPAKPAATTASPAAASPVTASASASPAASPSTATSPGASPVPSPSPALSPSPSPAASPAAFTGPRTRVKMAVLPIFISAPLFIAQEKGYFTQAGIDLEMTTLWQASEIIAAFASGDLDGSAGGFGPAQMNAVAQGALDVRIVAPLHSEKPPVATPLVVRKALYDDGTVRSVAALKGRKVAINSRGSAVEYWMYAALATGGLTPADIDMVVMSFQDASVALANGSIDGALIGEPDVTRAELAGTVVRLTEDFVDDIQVTAVYFKTAFLNTNRPAVEQFLAAYLRGARDLEGAGYRDPVNIAILEKWTKVEASTIAIARVPFHDPDGRVHIEDFQKLEDFFVAQGVVRRPIDMAGIIDLTVADSARGILAARGAGR
jgi:NitT/TauT family transport system substrate-binding protein